MIFYFIFPHLKLFTRHNCLIQQEVLILTRKCEFPSLKWQVAFEDNWKSVILSVFENERGKKKRKYVHSCLFLSLTCIPSMHRTQIRITIFSHSESQHVAPCHPHVISNEYFFFSLSLSVSACFRPQSLSFQERSSYVCCRETLHYPGWLSFLLSGVSVRNRPAGDSHTQKHFTVNRHTSSVESEHDRFKDGCSEAKLTETLF